MIYNTMIIKYGEYKKYNSFLWNIILEENEKKFLIYEKSCNKKRSLDFLLPYCYNFEININNILEYIDFIQNYFTQQNKNIYFDYARFLGKILHSFVNKDTNFITFINEDKDKVCYHIFKELYRESLIIRKYDMYKINITESIKDYEPDKIYNIIMKLYNHSIAC